MKGTKNNSIMYQSKSGEVELRADVEKDTMWASLDQIANIFDRDKSVISRHLGKIFKESELTRDSVVAKNATTAEDGKTYMVDYYNLDVIIAVGYRVNSKKATQFRIWATKILREHLITGFTLDRKKLIKSEKNFNDLQEALVFIKSKSQGGPVKAKLSLRVSKDLMV